MPDLRNLNFNIRHDIKDRNIEKANKTVESYKKEIINSDRSVTKLGNTSVIAGRKITKVGTESSKAAMVGNKNFKVLDNTLKRVGMAVGGYFAFSAIKSGLTSVVGLAAEFEETTNKFNVVFGELEGSASKWAEDYSEKVGRSTNETRMFLAESQNMLVGFGANRKQGLELSKSIQTLGVNLASFNNLADDDAISRLQSGLLGNHEAVKALGIVLNENTLSLELQRLGIKGNFAELDPLTKIQVRYSAAVRQSTDALGDAERSGGSFTNQVKRLQGSVADTAAEIGLQLLPPLTTMVTYINNNKDAIVGLINQGINVATQGFTLLGQGIQIVSENSDILIPVLAGVTAGFTAMKVIGIVNAAIGLYEGFMASATIATLAAEGPIAAVNALLLANPFGAAALAIAGLVAAGVALYKNWDRVLAKGREIKENIGNFFSGGGSADTQAFQTARGGGTGPSKTKKRGFQTGTSSAPAGIFNINENRSSQGNGEMIEFKGGERVYPAATSRRMGNGNGGMNNNITINVSSEGNGEDLPNRIVQEIDQYFRNMATSEGMVL